MNWRQGLVDLNYWIELTLMIAASFILTNSVQLWEDSLQYTIKPVDHVGSCHRRFCGWIRIDAELRKYRGIFNHGTQTAYQPRQVCHKVLLVGRMTQDAGSIRSVAY
jgi:hypothetical protein